MESMNQPTIRMHAAPSKHIEVGEKLIICGNVFGLKEALEGSEICQVTLAPANPLINYAELVEYFSVRLEGKAAIGFYIEGNEDKDNNDPDQRFCGSASLRLPGVIAHTETFHGPSYGKTLEMLQMAACVLAKKFLQNPEYYQKSN